MRTALFLFAALVLCGCGTDWYTPPRPATTSMEIPLDGVKLLSPDIRDPHDERTFQQAEYEIHPKQILLLRYEKLGENYQAISTDNGKTIVLKLSVLVGQHTGRSPLEVCPVTRNWTMHATWQLAHPFGGKGIWNTPGGDFARSGCVTGNQKGRGVTFDVTRWYIDYARARRENLGLLLKSDSPVRISGELDGEGAPRLFFEKFVSP